MFNKINIIVISIFIVAVFSCNKNSNNLKTIHQQKTGDVIISILNESGNIQRGSDKFYIEFRNATNNQLIDAGSVKAKCGYANERNANVWRYFSFSNLVKPAGMK